MVNEKLKERSKIICNISGEPDYFLDKHPKIIGNAGLITQTTSANENYKGRFDKSNETIRMGAITSFKIYSMLKFLITTKNTKRSIDQDVYLLSWFSDDLANESGFRLDLGPARFAGFLGANKQKAKTIDDETSKNIVSSFITGRQKFSDSSKYYGLILDKVSQGRIAVRYFKKLDVSQLKENLSKWENTYYWYYFDQKNNIISKKTPSLIQMVQAAYGIDRKNKAKSLEDSDDKYYLQIKKGKLKASQIQNMIIALMDGKKIPANISTKLKMNIRNRQNYPNNWNLLKFTTLAVLREEEGFDNYMLDRKNYDRSYLFGRLLALYERLEASTYEKNADRPTNAERLWTSYINKPLTVMLRLDQALSPYKQKLIHTDDKVKKGLGIKINKEINEVINLIGDNYDYKDPKTNKALDVGFIFGYEAQMRDIFTKKKEKEKEVSDDK